MTSRTSDPRWRYQPRIRRSFIERVWAPWNAVRSWVYLDEWLHVRLAWYLQQMPQLPHDVPFGVRLRGIDIVVDERAASAELPPGSTAIVAVASDREHQVAQSAELELSTQLASVKRAADIEERKLALAVADGTVHPRGREAVRSERPAMPALWPLIAVAAAIAAFACCEALMVAIPFWDSVGVDTRHLGSELRTQPLSVLGGGVFALAAVVALIGGAERIRDLWRQTWGLERCSSRERWSSGTILLATGATLCVTAYGLAAMRHGMSAATSAVAAGLSGGASSGGFGAWVFVSVTLLILLVSPSAMAWLRRRLEARRASADGIRGWECKNELMAHARERIEESVATARARVTETTRQHERAITLVREIDTRTAESTQRNRTAAADAHKYAIAHARALLAALAADRYAFIRHARRRGRSELIATAPVYASSSSVAVVRIAS